MSTQTVPIVNGALIEGVPGLYRRVVSVIRAPDSVTYAPPNVVYTFTPDLTAGEVATFNNILATLRSLVPGITPAEWQAIQSDIDGLVTYQGLASPTLAQTVLAVKAQSRILRAILKN